MKKQADTFNICYKKTEPHSSETSMLFKTLLKHRNVLRFEICSNQMQCESLLGMMTIKVIGGYLRNLKIDWLLDNIVKLLSLYHYFLLIQIQTRRKCSNFVREYNICSKCMPKHLEWKFHNICKLFLKWLSTYLYRESERDEK